MLTFKACGMSKRGGRLVGEKRLHCCVYSINNRHWRGKGHGADMKKGCAGIMIKKRQHKDKKIEKKKIMKIILNKKMTTRAAQE